MIKINIEMPIGCAHCFASNIGDELNYACCSLTNNKDVMHYVQMGFSNENKDTQKPSWCPIEEVE